MAVHRLRVKTLAQEANTSRWHSTASLATLAEVWLMANSPPSRAWVTVQSVTQNDGTDGTPGTAALSWVPTWSRAAGRSPSPSSPANRAEIRRVKRSYPERDQYQLGRMRGA